MIDLLARPWARRSRFLGRNTRWAEISALFDRPPANLEDEVRQIVGSGWVEELVVRGDQSLHLIEIVLNAGRAAGRRIRWITDRRPEETVTPRRGERWIREEDTETISWVLAPRQRARWQLVSKRLMDVIVSASLLVILAPFLVAIAALVRLTSNGPIFYRWRVLGEYGRPFVGFKFRTMVRDADALKPQLLHLNERHGPVFKMIDDPRITPLGRWLRKYSIDELPQLWSVLKGDMSLVGPRPVFPAEYRGFEIWQMRKLSVKPGLTCLWQVMERDEFRDFSSWARLDLEYIDHWSLLTDLQILWDTPKAIIKGTGY